MRLHQLVRAPWFVARDFSQLVITYMPGPSGNYLRRWYYSRHLAACGENVIIDVGAMIDHPEMVSIGNDVHIDKYCILSTGPAMVGNVTCEENAEFAFSTGELVIGNDIHIAHGCIIMAYGGVEIRDNCGISAGSKIYSLTNVAYDPADRSKRISVMPHSQALFLAGPIVLERNVWLGLNVVVMPGITIGADSFAASNSVIMTDFPDNSYIAGQPARRKRDRFRSEQI